MARKKGLKQYSKEELLQELARRHAGEKFHDDMTMSDIELAAPELKGGGWRAVGGPGAVANEAGEAGRALRSP